MFFVRAIKNAPSEEFEYGGTRFFQKELSENNLNIYYVKHIPPCLTEYIYPNITVLISKQI